MKESEIIRRQLKRALQRGRDIMSILGLWDEKTTKAADKIMKDEKLIDKIYKDFNEDKP